MENSATLDKRVGYFCTILGFLVFSCNLYYALFSWYVCIFSIMGLFLLLFVAPFLAKEVNSDELFRFQCHLISQMIIVWIITLALIGIASFVIFSLEMLFDVNFEAALKYIAVFVVSFLSHIILMSKIPKQIVMKGSDAGEYKSIIFILQYIVLPFLLIYATILHLYAFKIFFLYSLSKGTVAYLVCIFSSIGIVTYLIAFPFRNNNKLFNFFSKNFFKALLVPTFLLTVSICVRIKDYGITENRYVVLLLLCWFLLSICFSFLFKNVKLLKYIVVSISMLFVFASLPVVGVVGVSKWSQERLLETSIPH